MRVEGKSRCLSCLAHLPGVPPGQSPSPCISVDASPVISGAARFLSITASRVALLLCCQGQVRPPRAGPRGPQHSLATAALLRHRVKPSPRIFGALTVGWFSLFPWTPVHSQVCHFTCMGQGAAARSFLGSLPCSMHPSLWMCPWNVAHSRKVRGCNS